ncbi:MAG: hypothetical protein GDA36_09110 [Rhodobacteraceae bacterium]|nr:hypothetical protein [Paracoccaceae bacterium]
MKALAKRFVHRREHRLSLASWRHRFLAGINTTSEELKKRPLHNLEGCGQTINPVFSREAFRGGLMDLFLRGSRQTRIGEDDV